MYRRAHWFYKHNMKFIARAISQKAVRKTGIEIHPACFIGKGLLIDHGIGVVIGETAIIGDNVTLYQGVTLGGTGKETGKRHPNIGDNVMISAGAKIIGSFTVGENSKIGAGSVVTKDIPPYIIAGREPARYCGLNIVGLRRRGFSNEAIKSIRDAYRHIYESNTIVSTAVERIKESGNITPEVEKILHFIEKESERGIIA